MTPCSSIVNNYLQKEIALKFYAAVFSLLRRTFPNGKAKFFNFTICSVFYKTVFSYSLNLLTLGCCCGYFYLFDRIAAVRNK